MIPLAPRSKQMMGSNTNNNSLLPSPKQHKQQAQSSASARILKIAKAKAHNSVNNNKHNMINSNKGMSTVGWRRYGIDRRRQLLEQDELEGGNKFHLNYQCRIQGYFALSEKIIAQFNDSFANESDIEVVYVMGNRLCHFLTEALPRHPAYMKKDPLVSRLREKSLQSLVHINKRIEALALRIDEEQLNKYIMHDFDPFADDDDDDSCSSSGSEMDHFTQSCSNSAIANNDPQWESFDGWSFDLPDKLKRKANQQMSYDNNNLPPCKDVDVSAETEDTSNETFSSSERSFQASDDYEPIYAGFGLDFLRRIASESVRYETDSDADDSWAQECESEVESAIYSTTSLSLTYDPARIALQELMLNKRRRQPQYYSGHSIVEAPTDESDNERSDGGKENHSVNFDLSPDNTFDNEEEEEISTAFRSKSLLPSKPSAYSDRVNL